MNKFYCLGLLAASLCCCAFALGQVLRRTVLDADPQGMPGERVLCQTIDVGPDTKLDATIEVTAKGNGTLSVGNLRLRVVDEHENGAVYQDGMAHVEFADVDGDGWKDLVVVGIVNYTDEKADAVPAREAFVFMYRYDPGRRTFQLSYKHATFELEDGPQSR